ncbi:MAG: DUF3795 domain-containing protein [Nanoarchaeota archaeon]|nr:DUF3795 domain-containing protein [Nanoarchaeota archaeon]
MSEIACCGIDCEKCVKFKDKFAEKTKEIIKSVEESNLDHWQEHEPREEEFNYQDFKKGLVWFEKHMRCVGCHDGGGCGDCIIKSCCKNKDIDNCSKCSSFPCDKVRKFKNDMGIDIEKNFKVNE